MQCQHLNPESQRRREHDGRRRQGTVRRKLLSTRQQAKLPWSEPSRFLSTKANRSTNNMGKLYRRFT